MKRRNKSESGLKRKRIKVSTSGQVVLRSSLPMESVAALIAEWVSLWGDDQAAGAINPDLRYTEGVAGQRNRGFARGPDLEGNGRRVGQVYVRRRQQPIRMEVDVQACCETGVCFFMTSTGNVTQVASHHLIMESLGDQ